MKKACILGLALLIGIAGLSAQGLTVGPKVSFGSSNLQGEDWDLSSLGLENKFYLTISAGLFVILEITPNIGLQFDLAYMSTGMKSGDDTDWMKIAWNTISFPVYGRFSINVGALKPYLLAGLDMNLLFGDARYEDSSGSSTTSPVEDQFDKTFLIGFAVGSGVTLPIGPGLLDLGLRYRKNVNEALFADMEIYHQSLNLDIAYGFKVF